MARELVCQLHSQLEMPMTQAAQYHHIIMAHSKYYGGVQWTVFLQALIYHAHWLNVGHCQEIWQSDRGLVQHHDLIYLPCPLRDTLIQYACKHTFQQTLGHKSLPLSILGWHSAKNLEKDADPAVLPGRGAGRYQVCVCHHQSKCAAMQVWELCKQMASETQELSYG
jgi:hypothetical protein